MVGEIAMASSPAPVARVLLAEDNATNRHVIVSLLVRLGCSVDTVENGVLAVEAAARMRYDLIFMDVQMPELDGPDAARLIRVPGSLSADVPVIAVTASDREEDRRRCEDVGMSAYLRKPFGRNQLAEVIRNHGFAPLTG